MQAERFLLYTVIRFIIYKKWLIVNKLVCYRCNVRKYIIVLMCILLQLSVKTHAKQFIEHVGCQPHQEV